MTILQITPGAGAMYCGNCLRDNALVATLRKMGHTVQMVPLYLPLTLDEEDQSHDTPIFFSGINVYLDQKSALFRGAPGWFHNLLTSRRLLKWAAGRAAKTRAEELGDMTLSMLRGEAGNQARELDDLLTWLKTKPKPDIICLSNGLLVGMLHRLKTELRAPVVCMLQGEDGFLDSLPEPSRAQCWKTLAEHAAEADMLTAPSHYFARLMSQRLNVPSERVRVIYNGINLSGYSDATSSAGKKVSLSPVLGYFARMCREKGLDTLVEAFILLRRRERVKNLTLRIGGSCGPADEPFVNDLRERLRNAGLLEHVTFHPNLDRNAKVEFLRSLSVLSVPARYGEAFGLYVIEALAAGVPVVQPRTAAFPELIEATGGGLLSEPNEPASLADMTENLLLNNERARELGERGRRAVFEKFSSDAMATESLAAYQHVIQTCAACRSPLPA